MTLIKNRGSFSYNALQLVPDCTFESDHHLAWTFERRAGFDIKFFGDSMKWTVSWVVDGIDVSLDIHTENVLAVAVGPKDI